MKIPFGPVELVICVFRHPFELVISYGPRTPDEPIKGFDLTPPIEDWDTIEGGE